MSTSIPRFMVAAPSSGSGKTVVTCALLRALARRGLACAAFKCGPDYIDPLFHRRVVGARSGNLDGFFTDAPTLRALLARGAAGADAEELAEVGALAESPVGEDPSAEGNPSVEVVSLANCNAAGGEGGAR